MSTITLDNVDITKMNRAICMNEYKKLARAANQSAPGKVAAPVKACPTSAFTTTPIEDDENWTRLPKPGQRLCGLTRSHLYALYTSGQIRSVSIRRPHHKRGVRLIFRPSLHAFLARLDEQQNGPKK
jgi:hypothetical protein